MKYFSICLITVLLFSCGGINPPVRKKEIVDANDTEEKSPLRNIKLPEGFKIEVYADDINNARSICLSPKGTLFVGNRKKNGNVYALLDTDGDHKVDKKYTLATDLFMPKVIKLHPTRLSQRDGLTKKKTMYGEDL